ncbi:mycothiol-dependent nitroreductase Rv2466c family protein [Streptomyces sp. NPDC001156]
MTGSGSRAETDAPVIPSTPPERAAGAGRGLSFGLIRQRPEPFTGVRANAAALIHGPEVLEPLYTALGTRFHLQQQPKDRATLEAALRETGLPVDLADIGATDRYDDELRASHRRGITLVGQDVGSPIISVPGPDAGSDPIAFFGPVVTPAPKGEDAARLWDGVLAVASTPGFYEIKRTRTSGPDFS